MNENRYRYFGWGIFAFSILLWFVWCMKGTGLVGWFMDLTERLVEKRLHQTSCFLSLIVICLPGYIAKQYFEALAWQEHVSSLPPPDIRESAKRSKYVQADAAPPPAPKPVEVTSLPAGQEEFIATCTACGRLFSAQKSTIGLKCPTCGETIK